MYVFTPPLLLLLVLVNRCNVFALTRLHPKLYNSADIYLEQIDFHMHVFAILQLLSHVNALITSA